MQSKNWIAAEPAAARSGLLKADVLSQPYLSDHGFHDLIVLPGTFYLQAAVSQCLRISSANTLIFSKLKFHNPVILSKDGATLEYRIHSSLHEATDQFEFCQPAEVETGVGSKRLYAAFDLLHSAESVVAEGSISFSKRDLQDQPDQHLTKCEFYRQLRSNGNQYGSSFQNIVEIWRRGPQALGLLERASRLEAIPVDLVDTATLDSVIHVLAATVLERAKTFILKSIDRVEILRGNLPQRVWVQAEATFEDKKELSDFSGNIEVTDDAGNCYIRLCSVKFSFLPIPSSTLPQSQARLRLCVSATMTSDPIESSLKFWGSQFGLSVDLQFAPYNQVFQQLLDGNSPLRRNQDGNNLLLIGLEDWLDPDSRHALEEGANQCETSWGRHTHYVLPNGVEIAHLNRYETEYVYQEIFEDKCYLRHGIEIQSGATIIDIGANIGLFSLFVLSRCDNVNLYAFEPSPVSFGILQANLERHGPGQRAKAFNFGVADRTKSAEFTFYEKSSVFSGFHPDQQDDRGAIEAVVRNTLQSVVPVVGESIEGYVQDLTHERLERLSCTCQLLSVSDIIRQNGIERIHLLKIDAEKSEWEIISGIEDSHWSMIDQIVIEIHDRTGAAVRQIESHLNSKGFRCAVVEENLLHGSGLFNLYAKRPSSEPLRVSEAQRGDVLSERVNEFCSALEVYQQACKAPLLVAVAPRTGLASGNVRTNQRLHECEQTLLERLKKIPSVASLGSTAAFPHAHTSKFFDRKSYEAGHMPYTTEGYAALGTALFKALVQRWIPAVKVLVLDCDNTLWKGVCAEEGPNGVEISTGHKEFQEFLRRQMQSGTLLCLSSKNREEDVWAVFEKNPGMVLKRNDIVAYRINWEPKSINVTSLAQQLNLGLDSFVFIDDNPVECAEVRAGCPGAVILQLPQDEINVGTFLPHLWIFDQREETEADRKRTLWYRSETERQKLREEAPSLKSFLAHLQLSIQLEDANTTELARVSQLTFRTNQFNLTTVRRTESELREYLKASDTHCVVARVRDRFADYGLVGVILYRFAEQVCEVDTVLLSCRALGKGVEHQMLADLGQRALNAGCAEVRLPFRPSERNQPALEFLRVIGFSTISNIARLQRWDVPAAQLAVLKYEPDAVAKNTITAPAPAATESDALPQRITAGSLSFVMQRIGEELNTVESITRAIAKSERPAESENRHVPFAINASPTENALSKIWRSALGKSVIGLNDNFFEVGGTSLKAVLVVAMIQKDLKEDVSIVTLFECPTIKLLADRLKKGTEDSRGPQPENSAAQRGLQRRNKPLKRRMA